MVPLQMLVGLEYLRIMPAKSTLTKGPFIAYTILIVFVVRVHGIPVLSEVDNDYVAMLPLLRAKTF